MIIIVGLGNPGDEYRETRHNTGRMALEYVKSKFNFEDWQENKKIKARTSDGKIGKEKILLIEPETFMNKSGSSLVSLIKTKKALETLIVIYDDLDLPVGKMKISYNRSSGGHRGLESIIKSLKSEAFARFRVGISPKTPSGKLKKPVGDKVVGDFILEKFKPSDFEEVKKVFKKIPEAVEMFITSGRDAAMGEFNK